MKFYLLAIVNHNVQCFNLRLEDGDGGIGCRHGLVPYIAEMAKQVQRFKGGHIKGHWRIAFWAGVLCDAVNVEQIVLGSIEAEDNDDAKERMSDARAAFTEAYMKIGYTAFREDINDLPK